MTPARTRVFPRQRKDERLLDPTRRQQAVNINKLHSKRSAKFVKLAAKFRQPLAQKRRLKDMRKQQELQAMEEPGAALQANAHNLPLGTNRDELLRDIWRFRAEVAARKLTVTITGIHR
jgi:hypothetical protein